MEKCWNYGAKPMVFDSKRKSNYKPDYHRGEVCTADNQIDSACLEIGHYIPALRIWSRQLCTTRRWLTETLKVVCMAIRRFAMLQTAEGNQQDRMPGVAVQWRENKTVDAVSKAIQNTLHIWFAIALLLCFLVMKWIDYTRFVYNWVRGLNKL